MKAFVPLVPSPDALVSVGVPVRNGGEFLGKALDALLMQDHENLQIVVCDNASTDATGEIANDYAARDARVRYVRREAPADAQDNFRFAFEQTSGQWFCWASHDDLRDTNFVSGLLQAFRQNPYACLAVPQVRYFHDHEQLRESWPHACLHDLRGIGFPERHERLVANGPCQIYGLMRAEVLRRYPWPLLPYGVDWLTLHWLAAVGEVVAAPEVTFYYYVPPRPRSDAEANAYHWLGRGLWRGSSRLPDVRWARAAAPLLAAARTEAGHPTNAAALFPWLCFIHHGGPATWAKVGLYSAAGPAGQRAWKQLKSRLR